MALIIDYRSPEEVIETLGANEVPCTNVQPVALGPSDTYIAAATTCFVGTEKVVVASFQTADQRAQYLSIGLSNAGAYPHFVMGSTWAVATLTTSTAEQISTVVGGTVH